MRRHLPGRQERGGALIEGKALTFSTAGQAGGWSVRNDAGGGRVCADG